jgi:predicted XRE-type DNA-binding protein
MTKGSRFESVWDAIENTPQQTAAMRARSESMMALQAWVKLTGGTQAEAARRLGVMQPRMSDLMCGKIGLFGLESLLDMATTACLEPHVTINKPRAPRSREKTELVAG